MAKCLDWSKAAWSHKAQSRSAREESDRDFVTERLVTKSKVVEMLKAGAKPIDVARKMLVPIRFVFAVANEIKRNERGDDWNKRAERTKARKRSGAPSC
jgi:hypothetical protein